MASGFPEVYDIKVCCVPTDTMMLDNLEASVLSFVKVNTESQYVKKLSLVKLTV